MDEPGKPEPPLEDDSRFPSGPWRGYFLQAAIPPGRHGMDLHLTFRQGTVRGEGHDRLGPFLIEGTYDLSNGKCGWTKHYVGGHSVSYQGFNEGKGIWGTWRIPPSFHGGFHIWPLGMGEAEFDKLAEEQEVPALVGASVPGSIDFDEEDDASFGTLE